MTRELASDGSESPDPLVTGPKTRNRRVRSGPVRVPWWHMFLIYPTLAVALITTAPGLLQTAKAFLQNQTTEEYLYAVQQQKFWIKNGVCVTSVYNPDDFANDSSNVTAFLCPTKDIVVVYMNDTNGLPVYAGIEMNFLRKKIPFKEVASNEFFGLAAYAATQSASDEYPPLNALGDPAEISVAQGAQVICQQMQADGRTLLRHINNGAGACFDEYVDTFTGMVTSVQQVPCRQTCG